MADGSSPAFAGLNLHKIVETLLDTKDNDASVFEEARAAGSGDSGVTWRHGTAESAQRSNR